MRRACPDVAQLLRGIGAVCALLMCSASSASAQRVVGQLLRPDSVTPVSQALVEWRTTRGAVQRVLSDQRGRFLLALPTEDSVFIRILRPGFRPQVVDPLFVEAGGTVSSRIVVEASAVTLSSLRIRGESACADRSDASAWTLLEQARTAMLSASLAERDASLAIEAVEYEGDATPAGAIVLRDSSIRRAERTAPSSRAERDSIFRFGYVRRTSDTSYYHAPTPDVLLDERFNTRYCMTLVMADSSPSGMLGVRFQPARRPGPGIADVTGVIWLDDDRYLLSRIEFEYLNVPPHHRVDGLGGYLEYAVLPTGHWLLREWLFRMPNLVYTRRAPISLARPDGSYPSNRAGEPIRTAVPVVSGTGLWAQGRTVYRVTLNGQPVLSDSASAALLERPVPPQRP